MADRTHPHDTSTPAMSAETVPSEEFVLVPRELTERMALAGESAASFGIGRPNDDEAIRRVWREMIAAAPTLSASHLAKEGGEAGVVEAAYRKGVLDACELVGPPDDWTDAELTEHGRFKREAMHYARRELLKPLSVARALASQLQPSPALAKSDDAVRLLPCPFCGRVPTLHPHSPDHKLGAWVSCSTCGLESPTETGQSVEVAVQHWNTRAALSTPTEGPASQTEGMGGETFETNVSNSDLAQMALCQVSWVEEGKVEHPHRLDTIREALARLAAIGPAIALEAKAAAYMNAEHLRQYAAKECDGIFWASPDRSEFYDTPLFAALTPPETAEAVPAASDPAPATDDRERLVEANRRLINLLYLADEALMELHGCFPNDEVTEEQRRLKQTCKAIRALTGEDYLNRKGRAAVARAALTTETIR